MKWISIILVSIFLLFPLDKISAEIFEVVERQFFWSSPNVTKVEPVEDKAIKKRSAPLGEMSYQEHFNLHGTPPPLNFLQPLKEGDSSLAQIKDGHVIFRKTGKKIPLNRSIVPSWANPVPPYLLSNPSLDPFDGAQVPPFRKGKKAPLRVNPEQTLAFRSGSRRVDRVLVVYPYYFYQCKENGYFTEMYSDRGVLLSTFDNLPTHVSLSNPYLLVSPEKSGCCESLKWSFRFYNLRDGSISEYSCPEGFCGNVLFTKLGNKGLFVIAQEIVGKVSEVGASMQTNFFIVGNEGTLSASGKTIYAVREPNLDQQRLEALTPYAISNLISINPLPEKDNWILHFSRNDKKEALKLVSTCPDPVPSVVFLLSKDPSLYQKKGHIIADGRQLGSLPLLLITEPGQHMFSSHYGEGQGEKVLTKDIQSDQINLVMFQ